MLDILLFYVAQGSRIIRLDAIAYLWKQLGTSCAHLPQTHTVVQLMRDILDLAAPDVLLLSETNVPHAENVSYFGDGANEAQIVYNFPLPPLVLYTITTGDATHLTNWARTIEPPSERTTFLNFTASHDGIGVRPVADILSSEEFDLLVGLTTRHGGNVSCKNDSQGNAIPYELNINYFDALNNPHDPQSDGETGINRFLLSQSIALVLRGLPGIYIHSLLGSRGWRAGVEQSNQPRAINREKLDLDRVEEMLDDELTRRSQIYRRYAHMIRRRRDHKSFHPHGSQHILEMGSAVFAVLRMSPDRGEVVLAIHNVTGDRRQLSIGTDQPGIGRQSELQDLISGQRFSPLADGAYEIELQGYQFVWLKGTGAV
jgi:sucrose phosphorylase